MRIAHPGFPGTGRSCYPVDAERPDAPETHTLTVISPGKHPMTTEQTVAKATERLVAANDNRTQRTPAEHRAMVAEYMAKVRTNDKVLSLKSWPTATRLERAGRHEDRDAIVRWGALMDAGTAPPANDNWRDSPERADNLPVPQLQDCSYEMRPSEDEVMRLASIKVPKGTPGAFLFDWTERIGDKIVRRRETRKWLPARPITGADRDDGHGSVRGDREIGGLRYAHERAYHLPLLVQYRSGRGWYQPSETWRVHKAIAPEPRRSGRHLKCRSR